MGTKSVLANSVGELDEILVFTDQTIYILHERVFVLVMRSLSLNWISLVTSKQEEIVWFLFGLNLPT